MNESLRCYVQLHVVFGCLQQAKINVLDCRGLPMLSAPQTDSTTRACSPSRLSLGVPVPACPARPQWATRNDDGTDSERDARTALGPRQRLGESAVRATARGLAAQQPLCRRAADDAGFGAERLAGQLGSSPRAVMSENGALRGWKMEWQ